ncbi:MAG TPA: OmpA family protein [Terriglobales bacterium]|nr:OmpA family protein [Terriglobales bacterium]
MSLRSEGFPVRVLLLAIVVGAVAIGTITTAQAQDNPQPKVEIFGGYSLLRPGVNVGGVAQNLDALPAGWGAAATFNVAPHFGFTADFGGHYHTFDVADTQVAGADVHVGTIMFGPHLEARTSHFALFGEALFGLHRVAVTNVTGFSPDNAFGLAVGGGLDVHVSRHVDVRPVQLDFVHSKHTLSSFGGGTTGGDPDVSFNSLRYRAGLNFLLGVSPPGPPPSATCSVDPMDVYAGEPVTATARAMNFNPKRTLSYSWSGSGGKLSGKGSSASIDTAGLAPGSYTAGATISDGKKGQASCRASFNIKERPKNPPQVSCSANPRSVLAGTPSAITCSCSSPDNAPDYPVQASISNWSASGGRISGSGNTATLDTTGASAGPITATATCTDSRGLSSRATASVNVEVPPPPPQASKLNEINFARNSARVDNTAKAILDDVALRLQREADARAVIVGLADPKELKPSTLAAQRAANAKEYLTKEKGIDPSRIETRTGSGGGMKADIWIVPAGATFSEPGTEVVNVPPTKIPYGRHAAPAKKKKAKTP